MPPVGLLAIAALGLVLVYALPQRARERGDFAMVRMDDRFSADMRVIRASASRVQRGAERPSAPARPKAEANDAAAGAMSRPPAPLDRAATIARHELVAMRRERERVLARRAAAARRRALVGALAFLAATASWGGVVIGSAPAWGSWVAVAATTAFGTAVVGGRRAVRSQAVADARLVPVAREIAVAATATRALQRVSTERAAGHRVIPSLEETQAIRALTAEDLAPASSPSPLPAPELPGTTEPGWTPNPVPAPSYTLKPTAKQRTARPIDEADLAAGERAAEAAAERRFAIPDARSEGEAEASTATLDAILARRRRRSA